jgi:hypothetical protein
MALWAEKKPAAAVTAAGRRRAGSRSWSPFCQHSTQHQCHETDRPTSCT